MLVGIAKMAAEAELLEAKRQVDYRELEARSYISRNTGVRVPFHWMINPYRGCEIGCKYCYARYTHEFMELDPNVDFETKIFVKKWDEQEFRKELQSIPRHEIIAIGSATDPYQPAERRYEVTRRMLQVMAEETGRNYGLITKSDLVTRDVELFAEVARFNCMRVTLTITTVDEDLARSLEPRAPRPLLRLEALRKLANAELRPGISLAPVIPLINDSDASLTAVAREARAAGAEYLNGGILFLKPSSRAVFFPWLQQHFPHLVQGYKQRYDDAAYVRGDYVRMIETRAERIRRQFGFTRDPRMERYVEFM